LLYYPLGTVAGSVDALTDVLAATVDGGHILGASTTGTSTSGANITLSDIGVTIPQYNCLPTDMTTNPLATGDLLSPLVLTTTLNQTSVTAAAAAVNQVVTSPASNLAFLTYTPITSSPSTGVSLPYYVPGSSGTLGTVGSITLTDNSEITAPIAGAFSPDDTYFFVSTAGDNKIHYISVSAVSSDPTNADTQQISPALPACSSTETGCTYTGNKSVVPATVIVVKPRVTT
jgi:hypothetical protein